MENINYSNGASDIVQCVENLRFNIDLLKSSQSFSYKTATEPFIWSNRLFFFEEILYVQTPKKREEEQFEISLSISSKRLFR